MTKTFNAIRSLIIEEIAESIDIPDSGYEKAEARYKDLRKWFGREEAACFHFNPDIYPQGSFRLGTVIRPISSDEEYDLDIGCRLRMGVTKATHTQQQLKELVGADLEKYRTTSGIKERKEEKHRCWRLKYADTLKFHLDTVPSIPESVEHRRTIHEAMVGTGLPAELARLIADLTGAITDNRMKNYRIIDAFWRVSNSEGFARWFESRIRLHTALMERLEAQARAAKVDELPAYRWKAPLQRCIQLLKRHRDVMFANDSDGKPASIIITTLSARAYEGEEDIGDALETILSTMGTFVNSTSPRVPNPVNPEEDFADRWSDSASRQHQLESKFWRWLQQAQKDLDNIARERKPSRIVETVREKLGVSLDEKGLVTKLGISIGEGLLKPAAAPTGLSFPDRPLVPKKPAGFA